MDDKYLGKKTSMKFSEVDIDSSHESAPNSQVIQQREVYKKLPEDIPLTAISNGKDKPNGYHSPKVDEQASNKEDKVADDNKMVHEEHEVRDGADEQMLGMENNKLTEKRDEVKFINGDHKNGDAKIDIGVVNGKDNDCVVFTGMTKEELMKYANDPFWVRMRWIFFIGFWAIWAGMLVGAILIIIDAPKCAAPEPLAWYKRGPLVKFSGLEAASNDMTMAKKMHTRGVIYELPPESTYNVQEPTVENQIKDLVRKYEDSQVNVVLDITPNYVTKDSKFMTNALMDAKQRSAFLWLERAQVPNNWLSIVNGSAWNEMQPGNFVLSQFGDGLFDLHMNSDIVKRELKAALVHMLNLGVKGFRLKNSKYFLVNHKIDDNEVPSNDPAYIHTQYGFWTHAQTTFQDGLGDLLYEYRSVVKNASSEAFLSIAEDMIRPQAYKTRFNSYGIDLPIYGPFANSLSFVANTTRLGAALNESLDVSQDSWLQWNFADALANSSVPADAYAMFMSLIPGTPLLPANVQSFIDVDEGVYKHIEELRDSNVFLYGDLHIHTTEGLLAYSRFKHGNPGYLIVFNPHHINQVADFSSVGLPVSMTVNAFSKNYAIADIAPKTIVKSNAVEVSPRSAIIYTYVPVQSE